jgi:hypothetical protein
VGIPAAAIMPSSIVRPVMARPRFTVGFDKRPRLTAARTEGCVSILALVSNDIALANYNVVGLTVHEALKRIHDPPDSVVVVEADGGLFYGWLVRNRTGIPVKVGYMV